ncbi:hypothetical protein NPIL_650461 [Nephila pilipes]|uniref:Uncharacterized protein n=1 Tax=Nephila pilipes TaxID=299642 RepID=A0A8X6Q3X6_NEPPI|nr:hypothetical protein NPIL_650461 [Nephila pilipes]
MSLRSPYLACVGSCGLSQQDLPGKLLINECGAKKCPLHLPSERYRANLIAKCSVQSLESSVPVSVQLLPTQPRYLLAKFLLFDLLVHYLFIRTSRQSGISV